MSRKTKTTRHRLTWTNPNDGKPVIIEVRHTPDYLVAGTDHVEIESLKPKRAVLPLTETGYRSEFITGHDLARAGGALAFVRTLLDQAEASKAWQKKDLAARQGDLFRWAAAEAVAALVKPPRKPRSTPQSRRGKTPRPG